MPMKVSCADPLSMCGYGALWIVALCSIVCWLLAGRTGLHKCAMQLQVT
jgi:hypothetical protein